MTITFTDGTEAAFSGSVVNATTEDGTDVTAFFNAFLDGFFKEKPEVAVNIDL